MARISQWSLQGGYRVNPYDPFHLEILKTLDPSRYHALPVPHLAALMGRNPTHLHTTIRNLKRQPNMLLQIASAVRQDGSVNRQTWYQASERAIGVLAEQGMLAPGSIFTQDNARQFPHQSMIDTTWANIEIGVNHDPNATFRLPYELMEHETFPQAQRRKAYPFSVPVKLPGIETFDHRNDGVRAIDFLHEGKTLRRYLQLEAENTKDIDAKKLDHASFRRTFLATKQGIDQKLYKKYWGFGNLLTLVTSPSEERIRMMISFILRETNKEGVRHVMFRHLPKWPKTIEPIDFYTKPWERAGHSPFHLNNPTEV